MTSPHAPVLLDEVIEALAPAKGDVIIDATFGAGGYTRAILKTGATVIALDRDPTVQVHADAVANDYPDTFRLIRTPFSGLADAFAQTGEAKLDGVVFDIGVSSMQLDQAERGFSFMRDGPLDMRMDQSGMTAAQLVNEISESDLTTILRNYGEEKQARRVAQAIVKARPLARTGDLANVVRRALGYRPHEKKDPATRTFQAIRIHLNRELDELEEGLVAAERALKPGGRLAVVTFHSLEDRMVKKFLRERSGSEPTGSRHRPMVAAEQAPSFEPPAKAIRAGEDEIAVNPRARSATLRVARRTAAPAWR